MEYFASGGCCVPNMKLHKMVLSLLGSRYAIHTKSRGLKDLGLGLQSGAACHIAVFLAFTWWKISRSGICVCMDCRIALFFCFHIFDSFLIWSLWHFIWHFGHNFLGGPPYIFLLCRSGWSGKLCASVLNLQGARRFTFWSSSFTSWWLMKATAAI